MPTNSVQTGSFPQKKEPMPYPQTGEKMAAPVMATAARSSRGADFNQPRTQEVKLFGDEAPSALNSPRTVELETSFGSNAVTLSGNASKSDGAANAASCGTH